MTKTVRVASVPADHPYVRHIAPVDDDGSVTRLPDPPVTTPDGTTRWWPPRMLDARWIRDHEADFDVLHVHFGFESFTPGQLADAVSAAHEWGKGVVVTVHDLRNPHIRDERAQLDRLDVLVPAADVVLTLTDGAARVIQDRWGREAIVVPHPHVVPLDTLASAPGRMTKRGNGRARVGLHLKSLRPNVDASGALDALALVAGERPDAELVVTLHRAIADPADRGHDPVVMARLRRLADDGAITLVLHDPMGDEALFTHVEGLDVSIMANMWGTHSGWIEMCHDLGVRVVAPDIGFYAEQHAPLLYPLADDAETIDPRRLADAVIAAIDKTPTARPASADVTERRAERDAVARTHAQAYETALAASDTETNADTVDRGVSSG